MERINGYLNINDNLNIPNIESIKNFSELYKLLKDNINVTIESYDAFLNQIVFSFIDNDERYYFKYSMVDNPYNELIVEEIAKCMDIEVLDYDLANIGCFKGNVSKEFKVDNAKYISGREILIYCYKRFMKDPSRISMERNNIQDIWIALEYRYKDKTNMREIVFKLVYKLIKILILDMMVGEFDRHSCNWGIVEYNNGDVDLQILFDNTRSLTHTPDNAQLLLKVDEYDYASLSYNLDTFIKNSSQSFVDMLKNNLWVIDDENVDRILSHIEAKIQCPIDNKEYFKELLAKYYEYINSRLEQNKRFVK